MQHITYNEFLPIVLGKFISQIKDDSYFNGFCCNSKVKE